MDAFPSFKSIAINQIYLDMDPVLQQIQPSKAK
jgi:hypothetical protein